MDNFLFSLKDNIKKSFKEIDPKYFDFKNDFNNLDGKFIRARYTYNFSRIFSIEESKSLNIALSSEIVHLASLLHDDCIDDAKMRRGKPTINFSHGINKAILLGDLIVSIAFKKANSISSEIANSLVDCISDMAKGALLEENLKYNLITFDDYKEIVLLKTSSLFKWISFSLLYIAKVNDFEKLKKISDNFGLSFQIIDDVLDIEGEYIGKDSFKDLIEGKINYPVLIALDDDYLKTRIIDYFKNKTDLKPLYEIREYIIKNGYIEKSRNDALNLIENMKDDIFLLGKADRVYDFYSFIVSLVYRKI